MRIVDRILAMKFRLGVSAKGFGSSQVASWEKGALRQTEMWLHGNLIAKYEKFGKRKRMLSFSTCGWETATTAHRLSALLDRGSVRMRKGKLWFCWAGFGTDPKAKDWISPLAEGRPEPVPEQLTDLENWD